MANSLRTSEKIADQLSELVRDLSERHPELVWMRGGMRSITLTRALTEMDAAITPILRMIASESSLGLLRDGWISFFGFGRALNERSLLSGLLDSMLRGKSAKESLSLFRKFSKARVSSIEWYGAVSGAVVTETCTIGRGFELVPWQEVPECWQRTLVEGESWAHDIAIGLRPKPNCAIRFKFAARQVLFSSSLDHPPPPEELDEIQEVHRLAENAVRAMTLVSECPVNILASWLYATEPVPRLCAETSFQFGKALEDSNLFSYSLKPSALDVLSVSEFLDRLEKFQGSEANALNTALDRIRFAIRQSEITGKAIDLGIAIEALLLHEIKSSRTELKYRCAVRAAQFLGGGKSERLATFKRLQEVYDLRSRAVHKGRLLGNDNETRIIESAVQISLSIARKIIQIGRFPKWEEEYVFSAD